MDWFLNLCNECTKSLIKLNNNNILGTVIKYIINIRVLSYS